VALKVLPFALTLDPRQLQRFKNEARAAAQLHHQHIVPVYFVGSERGVHFYAMQFIEGQSLAEAIAGLRQRARTGKPSVTPGAMTQGRGTVRGEPTGPFVPRSGSAAADTVPEPIGALATAYSTSSTQFFRAAARLGVQAAEALEHAHQYGVVHRDIKPGNLLVDAHGQVWVTDFGLAQFQADAGLTHTGDLLGTLRYMSPEQAGGQRVLLDHRTDVYSLGATLYELLTLRPPFDGTDRQTLLHQILNDEPRPLRAAAKSVPAELETIVLKALAKAPAERYATAREMADDLQRFLDNKPIRARRPSWRQVAVKWAWRHPSVVGTFVLICMLTAAGSLLSAELIHREQQKTQVAYDQIHDEQQKTKAAYDQIHDEQEKTKAAYNREQQRATEAEERFQLAREAVDEMLRVCREELAGKPETDGLRRRLLEDALGYYQKLIKQSRDDPGAQKELADNRDKVKTILEDLAVLHGAGQLALLKEKVVLDDLGLTDGERKKVTAVFGRLGTKWWEAFRDFHRLSPEEREQRFVRLARTSKDEFDKVLNDSQRERLRQVALQLQGPAAFRESDVVTALKLTDKQRDRIRVIEAKTFFGGPGGRGPGGPHPEDHEQKLKTASAEVQAVLTPEQQQEWQKMTGKPFQGRVEHFCPPLGPPGQFGPRPGHGDRPPPPEPGGRP
jgi:hypothetical protein